MRLFLKDFKDFELLAVEVKLFQANAPLYEKDFLPKFVFSFGVNGCDSHLVMSIAKTFMEILASQPLFSLA